MQWKKYRDHHSNIVLQNNALRFTIKFKIDFKLYIFNLIRSTFNSSFCGFLVHFLKLHIEEDVESQILDFLLYKVQLIE